MGCFWNILEVFLFCTGAVIHVTVGCFLNILGAIFAHTRGTLARFGVPLIKKVAPVVEKVVPVGKKTPQQFERWPPTFFREIWIEACSSPPKSIELYEFSKFLVIS